MMRRKYFGLALLLSLVAATAAAQQAYVNIEQRLSAEQLRETGLDSLTSAQLARLNELLRAENATAREIPRERTGEDRGAMSYVGLDVERITTRLKGSISSWEPGTVFELENGQSWKVLKGHMKLRKPMQAPEIVLVPGFAGRWFLQVDEDLPKARVYRID